MLTTQNTINHPTLEKTCCTHCGATCKDPIIHSGEQVFCCEGCQTVYNLLHENDLCYYYDLNTDAGVKGQQDQSFAYLEQPEISRQIVRFQNEEQVLVVFEIPSMHCSSCIWLLERLYKLDKGILNTNVNFPRKELSITYSPKETSLSKVVRLLHRLGYSPRLNLDASTPHKAYNPELRKLIYKIGVAGFAFGNIMLLAFPDYLAGEPVSKGLEQLFSYLSLLLSIPLFFYSASDYFRSAWNTIRMRKLHIDVPLAIGMSSMFFRSTYEILSGTGMGYLDSLGGLVFFLLIGKFVQQKNYSFLSFERDFKAYFPLAVQASRKGKTEVETIAVTDLQTGDTLYIKNDEIIPADSVLTNAAASIDYSFITGESMPQTVQRGQLIYAGGKNAGAQLELLVEKPVAQSHLTQLWNHPAFQKMKDTPLNKIIDRINSYFTPVVIVLAFAALFYWLPTDVGRALNAFTAVLIIACPCALVLASPFTYGHITRILGNYGFYLKNADVVEKLAYTDTLVFDKTGTLTVNDSKQIIFISENNQRILPDLAVLSLIHAVAKQSAHPLSRILDHHLAELLEGYHTPMTITDVQEYSGKGIEATVNHQILRIGSADFTQATLYDSELNASKVYVSLNSHYIGCFIIRQNYRPNLEKWLPSLKADYRIEVLSGDNDSEKKNLAPYCSGENALHFRQSPEQKLTYIQKLQQENRSVTMIGDGLNDAGALQQANVGISVTEDSSRFTPASDAIITGKCLSDLPKFLRLTRASRRIIWLCFFVSLSYNFTGTYFAVQGLLSPVIAAILMPFSSIGIITVATGATLWTAKRIGLHIIKKPDENHILG